MTNEKTEKLVVLDDQPIPKILATREYNMFKNLKGNRPISTNHVAALTKAIAKHNLLPFEAIVVNEHMQIIDGQHRLAVAKANKLVIYYTIAKGATLADIQELNSTSKPWTGYDYLSSYTEIGIESYEKITYYIKEYDLNLSIALSIFSPSGYGAWRDFKGGKLTIPNEQASIEITEAYVRVRKYAEPRVYKDREFVRAVLKLAQTVSIEEFITKLEVYAQKIEHKSTIQEYLRQFEEIYNYRLRGSAVRLF